MSARRTTALAALALAALAGALLSPAHAEPGDTLTYKEEKLEVVAEIDLSKLKIDTSEPVLVARPVDREVIGRVDDECDLMPGWSWYAMESHLYTDLSGELRGFVVCKKFWFECVDGEVTIESEFASESDCE